MKLLLQSLSAKTNSFPSQCVLQFTVLYCKLCTADYCRLLQYTPKAMFMVGMGRSQELVQCWGRDMHFISFQGSLAIVAIGVWKPPEKTLDFTNPGGGLRPCVCLMCSPFLCIPWIGCILGFEMYSELFTLECILLWRFLAWWHKFKICSWGWTSNVILEAKLRWATNDMLKI